MVVLPADACSAPGCHCVSFLFSKTNNFRQINAELVRRLGNTGMYNLEHFTYRVRLCVREYNVGKISRIEQYKQYVRALSETMRNMSSDESAD
jgi:hypothetical protein